MDKKNEKSQKQWHIFLILFGFFRKQEEKDATIAIVYFMFF